MGIATQYEGGLRFDGDQMYITTSVGTTVLEVKSDKSLVVNGAVGLDASIDVVNGRVRLGHHTSGSGLWFNTATASQYWFAGLDGNSFRLWRTGNKLELANDGTLTLNAYGAGLLKTNSSGQVSLDTSTYLTSVAFSDLTNKPTTLAGYGITDSPNVHEWEWYWVRYAGNVTPATDTQANWETLYKTSFIDETAEPADEGYVNTINDVGTEGGFGGSTYGNIFGNLSGYHALITTNILVTEPFTVTITDFIGDDSHAIFIDGAYVKGVKACCSNSSYTYTFTKGWHRIDLVYGEGGGGDYIKMGWNPKDYTDEISEMYAHLGADNPNYTLERLKGIDGVGSGLDSDLLDGEEGTHYLNYNNFTNTPTLGTAAATASTAYATSAQGTTADAALPKAGGTMTGNIDFGDSVRARFGNGDDLQIVHDGSNSFIHNVDVGNLYIRQTADDKDIVFESDDGSGGSTIYMYLDGSITETRFTKPTRHDDSVIAKFGNGNDLNIFHNGSNSYIETTNSSTGDFFITARGTNHDLYLEAADNIYLRPQGNENGIVVEGNAGVTLYYNNGAKLDTTSTGVSISGGLSVSNDTVLGNGLADTAVVHGHLGIGEDDYPKIAYPGKNAQWSGSGSTTGQIVIDLPGTLGNYDMMYMEIDIYNYSAEGGTKLIIGGHNWNSGGNSNTSSTMWHNVNVQVIGALDKPIYFGRRNDGTSERRCIAIGETDSTWSYGTVHVSKVSGASGFYTNGIDWIGDWNIDQTTEDEYFTKSPSTNFNSGTTLETNGDISASNFSGSSSGTNTGDQDLSGLISSITVGTGLDGTTSSGDATISLDLSELTDMTADITTTVDELILLDNGAERKKRFSEIFGSAAYSNTGAFATAAHNHAGTYALEYELMQSDSSDKDMHVWRKNHAMLSDSSGISTYIIVQTNVPQDNYSMGGFTLVYQDDYYSSGEGGEIKIYGYWNPESNNGFEGFRYECSNPYHTPTIEVCRNSDSGKTAFFISGEGGSYTQLLAKDLWLGYTATSATSQWGDSWAVTQASAKDGYTNFDTLNRNDFPAITTDGSTPALTGGVTAAEMRTLIGAGTGNGSSNLTIGTTSTTAMAGNTTIPTNNNQLTNGAGYLTSSSTQSKYLRSDAADSASELITFSKGISSDGNSKFYNWRALENSSNTSNTYWRIARVTGGQSSRFMITLAGRSTSYSNESLPAMGHIVGQLNNDNNYDVVFYNHSTASSEVVSEVGIVDAGDPAVDVYIRAGQFAELTATGHISDGSFTVYANNNDDGFDSKPTGYDAVTEYTSYNSGNLDGNQIIDWTTDQGSTNIHSGNYTDTDTWVANSATAAGYVASGASQNSKVWKTDANGVPAWRDDASGGTDTNYYLNSIARTDSTNTLVFSVSGASDQSFTFGSNAFDSFSDHTEAGYLTTETYTAHEATSTLTAGVKGSDANGTKIDTITIDANGHITGITTGATGNMTGFFVEDGDGTEVQINNANEWKFVEGTGIDINWSDTSTGSDTDPYDLTIACTIDSPEEVGLANLSSDGNALAGTFTATGDLIAYSDARVKENVETIPNALEKVTALRGVNFNKIGEEKRSTGVIAQEVAEVMPEVVHESEDGMLGVAYGNITGLLIEAIKEQQKQIDELKAQLNGVTK